MNSTNKPLVKSMNKISSQEIFKKYLKKIGSGQITGKSLSREESAHALELMLQSKASSTQIGAFMMAHRIRRPEPEELAGMIDTYKKLGPKINTFEHLRRPICFGMPFDGRNKFAPIYPLTSLVLLCAGQPVVLHGGKRMPVKFGVTTTELYESLGLDLIGLQITDVEEGLNQNGFACIYQPDHFHLAENLIVHREDIGKRPPLASMELIWTAHANKHLIISGFVHSPTEKRHWKALELLKETEFITIKGLEGGVDLPIHRTCHAGIVNNNESTRKFLNPQKYNLLNKEIIFTNIKEWKQIAINAIDNKGPLKEALVWNSGVYLWFSGITKDIAEGIKMANYFLSSGLVKEKLQVLIEWRNNLK